MHRFRKISALLLSMLVLLGSTSFTINMHFCMEQVESITFSTDTQECDMTTPVPPCHKEGDRSEENHKDVDGCCEDRVNLVEAQDELKTTGSVSVPGVQFFAVLYAVVFYSPNPPLENHSYQTYSPPVIERDIPVLVQSFLI